MGRVVRTMVPAAVALTAAVGALALGVEHAVAWDRAATQCGVPLRVPSWFHPVDDQTVACGLVGIVLIGITRTLRREKFPISALLALAVVSARLAVAVYGDAAFRIVFISAAAGVLLGVSAILLIVMLRAARRTTCEVQPRAFEPRCVREAVLLVILVGAASTR